MIFSLGELSAVAAERRSTCCSRTTRIGSVRPSRDSAGRADGWDWIVVRGFLDRGCLLMAVLARAFPGARWAEISKGRRTAFIRAR
jgi:hypothetical protein